ncbi:MAG: hypothetical protein ABIH53_04905 [archaeon]
MQQPQEESKQIIRTGNISLILDSYEDIFSDFDPRPYPERAMSDDFITECKKVAREKTKKEGIELRLLIPKDKRNKNEEVKIKKRLKEYFTKNFHEKQKARKKEKNSGMIWLMAGATLITLAAYLYGKEGILFNFLMVLLEPSGWFSAWTGLDKIFAGILNKQTDLEFYKAMSKIEVFFQEY